MDQVIKPIFDCINIKGQFVAGSRTKNLEDSPVKKTYPRRRPGDVRDRHDGHANGKRGRFGELAKSKSQLFNRTRLSRAIDPAFAMLHYVTPFATCGEFLARFFGLRLGARAVPGSFSKISFPVSTLI